MGSGKEKDRFLCHSVGEMSVDEGSGNDIKDILFHSVMIQREWSRKELISLPLWRQKERDYVSEKKRTVVREL